MNILTELALGGELGRYTATRGWSPAAIDQAAQTLRGRGWLSGRDLTAAGQDARTSIERDTDDLDAPVIAAIGDDLPRVLVELETWGRACIEARRLPARRIQAGGRITTRPMEREVKIISVGVAILIHSVM